MKTIHKASSNNPQNPLNSVKDAYDQLQDALRSIDTNEQWLQYLSFQTKFYNYSFSNMLLIFSQNPGASYVAGYKKWQSFDRYVRKGEHAIRILAPLNYKVEKEKDNSEEYKLKGFRFVSVFDISQTDGSDEHLPVLVSGLKESIQDENFIYTIIMDKIPIPIAEVDQLAAKGCYYPSNPRIEIRSSLSVIQKIKTLCHEFSHYLHHTKYHENESYEVGEVIAESAAFIVCSYLGIDSTDYSAPYIKSWSKDTDSLQAAATKIQKISAEIIRLIKESPDNAEANTAL